MTLDLYKQLILLGVAIALPLFFLKYLPSLTKEIIKDLRIPRILHYVSLAGLGLALRVRELPYIGTFFSLENIMLFILFIVALTYAAVFAIATNNIADLETDKITNPNRPLVKGVVDRKRYYLAALFCQIFALVLAAMTKMEMFWGILAISLGYYLYSCEPFRLKRYPLIAKLMIGFNSLSVAICGYTLAGGRAIDFPLMWLVFILIPLSLSANFVDLKDIDGDRLMGVKTFPVIWGEKRARNIIAIFTVGNYVMGGLLLSISWVYPLVAVMAILHIFFLYRKPYHEKWVFLIYVSALFGMDFFLFF